MPYKDLIKQKEAQAKHYLNNKRNYAISSKKAKQKKIAIIQKIKAGGCIYCGEKHIACLDFHHKDSNTKEFDIGTMMHLIGIKRILKEIEKCEVVCTNCHRKIHWKEMHPENPNGLIIETTECR